MAMLRIFAEDDVPAAVALFGRVYPESRWPSDAACESYFREIFFNNPWRDLELPSWIAEENGCAVGFLGVVPRPMLLHGRRVRAAVTCQFMVDPDRRHSLIALQLLRKCMSGSQEISVADGANDASGRLWQAAGGLLSPLYGLHWVRPLRPTRSLLLWLASRRPQFAPVARLGTPFAALADACAARFTPLRLAPRLDEEELDAAALLATLDDVAKGLALRPAYDLTSLGWLLAQARAKKHHGVLQSGLLRERTGRIAGWFMYYLNRGVSRVVQIGARQDSAPAVVEHLFYHAWRHGALALEGRMEPRFARVLGERHCFFHDRAALTLIHARDPATLDPLHRGDAFFTRLEAEWWMRFRREPDHAAGGVVPETAR